MKTLLRRPPSGRKLESAALICESFASILVCAALSIRTGYLTIYCVLLFTVEPSMLEVVQLYKFYTLVVGYIVYFSVSKSASVVRLLCHTLQNV